MNYLAHAALHVDDRDLPAEFLAGLAVPDWLSVVNRRVRCRQRHAEVHVAASCPQLAALAQGVVRHHVDDAWFHDSRAFAELSLGMSRELAEHLHEVAGMRPSFLGHILVELLLDAVLAERDPRLLDRYFARIAPLDGGWIAQHVALIAGCDAARDLGPLAGFVDRYRAVQFLRDYSDDHRLGYRLDQVLGRLGLPLLDGALLPVLPRFRALVSARADELLAGGQTFAAGGA